MPSRSYLGHDSKFVSFFVYGCQAFFQDQVDFILPWRSHGFAIEKFFVKEVSLLNNLNQDQQVKLKNNFQQTINPWILELTSTKIKVSNYNFFT